MHFPSILLQANGARACVAAIITAVLFAFGHEIRAQVGDSAQDTNEAEPPATTVAETSLLDAIVVTATRLEEKSFYVPYSTESLDGETLTTRKAVRTLPEALREVPGVMVQKTGHGQGSPFIRGFTGFRNLLLIDGIRLNNNKGARRCKVTNFFWYYI